MPINYQETIYNEEDLIKELNAPIKSVRLLALEEVINKGCSQKLLDCLLTLNQTEIDEECKMLLHYAITAVRSRLEKSSTPISQKDVTEIVKTLSYSNDETKVKILLNLPQNLNKSIIDWAIMELQSSKNPIIISTIIRKLGKILPDQILDYLITLLDLPNSYLKANIINLIIERNVNLLIPKLNQLLSCNETRIISLCIVALSKINPDLAYKFIVSKLKHSQASNINSYEGTIKALFIIPFVISKKAVLDVISYTNDLNLLSRIGLLLQINPEPDIPFILIEQILKSDPAKSKVLKDIFANVCQSIKESQILGSRYHDWLTKIKEFLLNAELERKKKINQLIFAQSQKDEHKTLVIDKLEDKIKIIENIKENNELELQQNLDINKNVDLFLKLSNTEQIKLLSNLLYNNNHSQILPSTLETILKNSLNSTELLKICLKIAHKYIYPQFITISFDSLQSKDDELVITALDYLSEFDIDKVIPYLGNFLKSSNNKIRLSAFKILIKHDFEQAIEFVVNLINNINPKQQELGLAFLNEIEFRLIREKIVDIIENTKNAKLLETFLNLASKNPDLENLFLLYRLSKNLSEFSTNINNEYKKQITLIKELNLASDEKIKEYLDNIATRFKAISASTAKKQTIREEKSNSKLEVKQHLTQEESIISDVVIGIILGLIILIIFLLIT